ncbi:hypothetical protein OS122_06565 [Mycolicibacterium mucogenicum]|nr:hypothetical protein [Mycolicibacterium mucogenicum]MCX8560540.1 hypothetical protein [Mycolicibacterium mucogenicum]
MHQVVNGRSPLADGHDVCHPAVSEYLSDAAVQLWKLPVVHRCIEHLNQLLVDDVGQSRGLTVRVQVRADYRLCESRR